MLDGPQNSMNKNKENVLLICVKIYKMMFMLGKIMYILDNI